MDGETENVALTMDDAATKLSALYGDDEPKRDDEQEIDEAELPIGDDGSSKDVDNEELDIEDEPQTAIAPPTHLPAEYKERFARLDQEAQAFVVDVELRRNQQVTEVTTRAADAEKAAIAAGREADARARLVYTDQLKAFGAQVAPIEPDASLADSDPAAFNAQYARYLVADRDHKQFMSQVEAMANEADTALDQAFIQARDAELIKIPEVANPETRGAFFDHVFAAAGSLRGIDAETLKGASADDLINLRTVAELKVKADKYDAALSKQMQRVREGKVISFRPRSSERPAGGSQDKARQNFSKSGSIKDAAALIKNML